MAYRKYYNRNFGQLGVDVAQKWPEAPVIARKGKTKSTLGLALSGGGYRSAIFNYGILKGLYELEKTENKPIINKFDYLSVVSGGSWIGTAFSTSDELKWFFDEIEGHPNLIEEGFESFLANPFRVAQELRLSRDNVNSISDLYGRLLARTFLREHGQASRFKPLCDKKMLKDNDRPFLIINGTVNFRKPDDFSITQECFEMTKLYCGSRSLGYIHSKDLMTRFKEDREDNHIRIRDAIAISGAAVALHLPGFGDEVTGLGLSREVANYALQSSESAARICDAQRLDVADGGHYNNLGVESLVNRGCENLIVVDAEHDREEKDYKKNQCNQKYSGLKTLLGRNHINTPFGRDIKAIMKILDRIDEPINVFEGADGIPNILYIKLKSLTRFDEDETIANKKYNKPSFFDRLFDGGKFSFDPQFSTAKLDYNFSEHRNLSDLGTFMVTNDLYKKTILDFIANSE